MVRSGYAFEHYMYGVKITPFGLGTGLLLFHFALLNLKNIYDSMVKSKIICSEVTEVTEVEVVLLIHVRRSSERYVAQQLIEYIISCVR